MSILKTFALLMISFFPILLFSQSQDQIKKSLNLEDISVKGDLFNDNRLSLTNRQKEELKNRVKFRRSFRNEILQEYNPNED